MNINGFFLCVLGILSIPSAIGVYFGIKHSAENIQTPTQNNKVEQLNAFRIAQRDKQNVTCNNGMRKTEFISNGNFTIFVQNDTYHLETVDNTAYKLKFCSIENSGKVEIKPLPVVVDDDHN